MKKKLIYSTPQMEVIPMLPHGDLMKDALSMPVDPDTPAWTGGDAKGSTFFDEDEDLYKAQGFDLWD